MAVHPSHIENPAANEKAGSTKRSANSIKLPETGKLMVISPSVWWSAQTQEHTTAKPRTRLPGPPLRRFLPDEIKSPAPICPPSEMICVQQSVSSSFHGRVRVRHAAYMNLTGIEVAMVVPFRSSVPDDLRRPDFRVDGCRDLILVHDSLLLVCRVHGVKGKKKMQIRGVRVLAERGWRDVTYQDPSNAGLKYQGTARATCSCCRQEVLIFAIGLSHRR